MINGWNEELTGISVMVWFRGEGEVKDRLLHFKLEQLKEMVALTLIGKSTGESRH